jgi:NDP-sugar pyrophosphorylase family protein
MQVVILAGGQATRLRPLTDRVPKSLVEIGEKPFLEHQLDFLKKANIKDVILCVGHLGEQIERYFGDGSKSGVNLKYSYEKERLLGTAGALKNAEQLLGDEFFVMYGDSYLFLDFAAVMSYFEKMNKLGLMVVYKNYDRYDESNVVIEGNLVKQYSKKDRAEGMVHIDYGASILRKQALKLVPQNQVYSLEGLFDQLIEQKELLAYEVDKRFYQIGSPEGLEEFKRYTSQRRVLQ